MIKTSTLTSTIIGMSLLVMLVGCSSPTSNPREAPPALRAGDSLDLTATEIWPSASGKPWICAHDWIIPEGVTVTVHPGTVIMFAPFEFDSSHKSERPYVLVEGVLKAEGTSANPIILTSAFDAPDLGQWRGIRLVNAQEGSIFRHCTFSYGAFYDIDTVTARGKEAQDFKGMFAIRNSSPIIERCIVMYNQDNGIFIHGENSSPVVRYNIVIANDASGIRADRKVVLSQVDVSYNCVADNSALQFLMAYDSTTYGIKTTVNPNLDSCDIYYNIGFSPQFTRTEVGVRSDEADLSLTSCSPCVDAGPEDIPDGTPPTRIDLGSVPYVQLAGELRGVIKGELGPNTSYRMSCHIRVSEEDTLTINAGTQIEVSGLYNIESFGKLVIAGTPDNPVHIFPCDSCHELWGGMRFFPFDTLSRRGVFVREPSVISHAVITDFDFIDVKHVGVRFEGVRFEHGLNYGVTVNTGSLELADTVSFQNCEFIDCGFHGLKVENSSATIRNTLVQRSKGRGIDLSLTRESVDITNCVVQSSVVTALALTNFSNPKVVNNVFYGSGYYGILLHNNCYPLVQNNIVANNSLFGIIDQLSSTPELSYNDFIGNGTDYSPDSLDRFTDLFPGVNPSFVNAESGDFHLSPNSLCINAGTPDLWDGGIPGDTSDIGAYGGPGNGIVGTSAFRSSTNRIALK
jgi:parallel beta-helix repeat protein